MIILFCTLLLMNCQSRQSEEKGKIAFYPVDTSRMDSVVDNTEKSREILFNTIEIEGNNNRGDQLEQIDGEVAPVAEINRAKIEANEDSISVSVDDSVSQVVRPVETREEKAELKEEVNPVSDLEETLLEHQIWDGLLTKYVDPSGKVDYSGFVRERQVLEDYLNQLSTEVPSQQTSTSEQLAYWINAYNANTVYLIVQNHPVKSILDLHNGKPWDVKWIQLGSKTYSLNEIEHNIIRKRFDDARIHFAVNCAAKSCPPLANEAFTSDNYEQLVERLSRTFINDSNYNKIMPNHIELSKIFEWYASDFGDLVTFLNRYSQTKINGGASISYLDYDWSLNGH